MGQKFRKVVNAPHKAMGRVSQMIEKTQPNNLGGLVLREAGLLTTDMLRLLLWATKYVTLDNHMLRGIENMFRNQRGNNPAAQRAGAESFGKKYPNLSAHLVYYLIALMSMGGIKGYQKITKDDDNDGKSKTEWASPVMSNDGKNIMVLDENTVSGILSKYWNEIAIGITELETYRKRAKVQGGEARATYGPGLTWIYSFDKNNRLIKDEATENMPALSYDESYAQMIMHLEYETLPVLRNATRGLDNITDKQKVALIFAGYQRPYDIGPIVACMKNAKTKQEIADAFMAMGDIAGGYRNGTLKRRWICAAYAVGLIDANDLLDMQRDAFSAQISVKDIIKDGHYKLDNETVKRVLGQRSGNNTVREFLSAFDTGRKVLAGEHIVFPAVQINHEHYDNILKERRAAKAKAAKKSQQRSSKNKSRKKVVPVKKKKTNRGYAFADASKKLGNDAYSADLDMLYLLTHGGHDMA